MSKFQAFKCEICSFGLRRLNWFFVVLLMALVFCSSDCWLKAQISFPLTETVELLPCFLRKCLRCLGYHGFVSQS